MAVLEVVNLYITAPHYRHMTMEGGCHIVNGVAPYNTDLTADTPVTCSLLRLCLFTQGREGGVVRHQTWVRRKLINLLFPGI
jgi:hypothetical protein